MSSENSTRGEISFDDVVIDTTGHRLLVSGVERSLEPKAFAVLVLLAGEPGRVFSRNEILDAVWGHSHVTPGVLNRIVTLLRQALDESARERHYVHTVHGIGYRLDADVHFANRAAVVSASKVVSGDNDAALGRDDLVARVPTAAAVERQMVSIALPSRPLAWRFAAMGLLTLLLVSLAWIVYARYGGPAQQSASVTNTVRARSVIVLPLRVIGGSAADAAFADGLGEDLITLLSRVDGMHVIARTSATLAKGSGEELSAIAKRLNVNYALEGSVQHDGDELLASLRLVDIATAQTLWAEQYKRAATDVFGLERGVATSVASVLALKLNAGLESELARSEDPVLYRRYLEARHQLQSDVTMSGAAKMQAPFRQLVADAPTYARGHAGLALALNQMSFVDPADAAAKHREAVSEARLALQMDPSLVDGYVVLGDAACRDADWEQCMALLRRGLELAPADSILRMWTSRHLLTLGYLTQALAQIKIGYAADPLSPLINYQFARTLDTLGLHDDAQHHLKIGNETHQAAFWFNAVWRGDLSHLPQFIPDAPHFTDSYASVGAALLDARQWPAARQVIDASEIPGKPRSNWLHMIDPQPDNIAENIAMMERVWRAGYSGMDSMLWNPEMAAYRRDPAFQEYMRRTHMLDYWRAHGWPDLCRASASGVVCS
ncbi:MAG: winged helix-turn-helix domain-containing protein [Dokdonella sp.]